VLDAKERRLTENARIYFQRKEFPMQCDTPLRLATVAVSAICAYNAICAGEFVLTVFYVLLGLSPTKDLAYQVYPTVRIMIKWLDKWMEKRSGKYAQNRDGTPKT
jgi:hypothetical protein